MTTPDLLTTVGFQKSKIGSGDKEVGYEIKEASLSSLFGSAIVCFLVMGIMVLFMAFDVRFERKTLHRRMRQEEHHAAAKLSQVQMELWQQYHDDIKESHEAQQLLTSMTASHGALQGKLQGAIDELSAELSLNPVKAHTLTEKILHLVADMEQANVKHTKHLVDHLVAVGKRSVKLEKHVDKEMTHELKEEKKHLEEDTKEGINAATPLHEDAGPTPVTPDPSEEDPLKEMITGFFASFDAFEKRFEGKKLKEGHKVYDQVKALWEQVSTGTLSEDSVEEALAKIDLASEGIVVEPTYEFSMEDLLEEITLIPKVPREKIKEMESSWKQGKVDSVDLFEKLNELTDVPTGWMRSGVNELEDQEAMQEDQMEAAEGQDEA